ncbi:MAG: NUDIX domain-containing protein [Nocardioides sp.]|uniref:NUDIX domain-containing protein n=1 Tax=Nocardioides sp. TaxID=35761 RepID=UPI0039E53A02
MTSFASVVLVDRRGWVLLQERDEHPVIDPEKWSLVGGHLDGDEEPAVGASRELAEETGVELKSDELTFWRTLDIFHEAYDSTDRIWIFVATCELTDDDIVVGEGRQIVFVAPEAVESLDLSETARAAVSGFLTSALYATMTS